uniref:Uncharacterized protein n=1 Tax=Arundo donax TaxID=35708 RepID=A0A0A8YVQ2_ARUDO
MCSGFKWMLVRLKVNPRKCLTASSKVYKARKSYQLGYIRLIKY